jgi:hypothetical protein
MEKMKKLLSLLLVTSILLTAVYADTTQCPGVETTAYAFKLDGNVVPTPYTMDVTYGDALLPETSIHVDLETAGNSEAFSINLSYGNCCCAFDVAVDLTVGDFINQCCEGSDIPTTVYNKSVSPSTIFDLTTSGYEYEETVLCGPNAAHSIGKFLIRWTPGADPAAGSYICTGNIDIIVT